MLKHSKFIRQICQFQSNAVVFLSPFCQVKAFLSYSISVTLNVWDVEDIYLHIYPVTQSYKIQQKGSWKGPVLFHKIHHDTRHLKGFRWFLTGNSKLWRSLQNVLVLNFFTWPAKTQLCRLRLEQVQNYLCNISLKFVTKSLWASPTHTQMSKSKSHADDKL